MDWNGRDRNRSFGRGSGAGLWIFLLVCAVIGGIDSSAGAILFLLGIYVYWMIH